MSHNNALADAPLRQEDAKPLPLFTSNAEMMMKYFDKAS